MAHIRALGRGEWERTASEADRTLAAGTAAYPVYLLLYALISATGGFWKCHPGWSLGTGAAIAATTLGRAVSRRYAEGLRARSPNLWRRTLSIEVIASAITWTAFGCFALAVEGLSWPVVLIMVASAGMSAAMANPLAPHLSLARAYHLCLLLPPVVVSFVMDDRLGVAIGSILLVQLAYQLWNSSRRHRNYWQATTTAALLRTRERTSALLVTALEHAAEAFEITSPEGVVQYVNPAFERMTGFAREQILGKRDESLRWNEPSSADGSDLQDALAQGSFWSGELASRTKDGRVRHQHASVSPVRDEGQRVTHHVWVRRDVTETRELQARLLLADRMASMGILAAGVAHEINNPLASLLLDLEEAERIVSEMPDARDGSRLRSLVAEGREASERVRDIVRQLRVFSRSDVPTIRAIRIDAVLDAAMRLVSNEVRHRAEVERDYGPELPAVLGDEGRLVQVFVNLLVNATQALDRSPAKQHRISVRGRMAEPGCVSVQVIDSGPGFDEKNVEKIFDPFFTTKPVGEGTGLGLAICHGIVTSLGGRIRAFNAPEGGGIVEVTLPVSELTAVDVPRHSLRVTPDVPHHPLHVLVADDELQVGRALGRALRGHQVTVVGSGREAVERWKTGDYDVMLCDVMMPRFTGMDVYRALAELGEGDEDRIVFMTGGAFTKPLRSFLDRVSNQVLEKPFDPRSVRKLLMRALEQHRRHTG